MTSPQRAALETMLRHIERRAPPARMELGLDRVATVFDRLAPDLGGSRIISVAGTNGKGSTVAFLEGIAAAAGRSCLAYSSPHIHDFGERFRIGGVPIPDTAILHALEAVENARGRVDLTWFEHLTLAAFHAAAAHRPDWLALEVGLGGRLDAVNIVDADVAVITSIGLDHQQWLGRTRAAIAREKCGIARPGRTAVVAEKDPPDGMFAELERIGARTLAAGCDFDWRWRRDRLEVRLADGESIGPVRPGLAGRHQGPNAAAAVQAARVLEPALAAPALALGLSRAHLAGRFERIASDPDIIVDVAHNPAACRALARCLDRLPGGKIAVFAALTDKDAAGMARALRDRIDYWVLAGLGGERGQSAQTLMQRTAGVIAGAAREALESVPEALEAARAVCGPGQRIIVFGSFMTVGEAIEAVNPTES